MKHRALFLAVGLSLLLSSAGLAGLGDLVASISGTRKFQAMKNGKNVITSEAVSAKTICAAFGVSTKDYAVVFNVAVQSLSLVPLKAVPPLPTFHIITPGNFLNSYNSTSPSRHLNCYTFDAGVDTTGTEFDGIQGFESFTVSETAGNPTGALGTFSGVAINANPDYSFFQLKFSAAKAFVQK